MEEFQTIYFLDLNILKPTIQSTTYKLMEETGELSEAILDFLPYENMSGKNIKDNSSTLKLLTNLICELLDVGQTCATFLFVLEKETTIPYSIIIENHINKLIQKGYKLKKPNDSILYNAYKGGLKIKNFNLPKISSENINFLTTMCKIQEKIGKLAQCLGKKNNLSGENNNVSSQENLIDVYKELLNIMQYCVTMIYFLEEKYKINIYYYLDLHYKKLKLRNYCK